MWADKKNDKTLMRALEASNQNRHMSAAHLFEKAANQYRPPSDLENRMYEVAPSERYDLRIEATRALTAAKWMEDGGHRELPFVGSFGKPDFRKG